MNWVYTVPANDKDYAKENKTHHTMFNLFCWPMLTCPQDGWLVSAKAKIDDEEQMYTLIR